MKKPLLLGCKGCGNAIVEAAFAVAAIPIDYEEVDYSGDSPTRSRLLQVNPLGQVPALVLADGTVMTESLAMLHYIDEFPEKLHHPKEDNYLFPPIAGRVPEAQRLIERATEK